MSFRLEDLDNSSIKSGSSLLNFLEVPSLHLEQDRVNHNLISSNEKDTVLSNFFSELIQQNNNGTLSFSMLSSIGDLYLKYSMEKEGKSIETFGFDKKEFMRYYTLGWFVYNSLISQTNDKYTSNT